MPGHWHKIINELYVAHSFELRDLKDFELKLSMLLYIDIQCNMYVCATITNRSC